ncbi:MAG TPA: glycerol-3-phosphate acyltransferase [Verrucomicrobiae bacterium]|jgi:glycerol-3-phosphate acyltransferase PlsY
MNGSPALNGGEWLGIFASYLMGCFATGYYLVRWKTGEDLRHLGSGNVGARNVGRVLGKWGFLLTFVGDFIKGAIPVWAAEALDFQPLAVIGAMLAAVIGHNWPAQLRFRGGKGVSASFGALAVYDPTCGLIICALFLVVFAFWRRFTRSGLLAFATAPFVMMGFEREQIVLAGIFALTVLVLIAHWREVFEESCRQNPRSKLKAGT